MAYEVVIIGGGVGGYVAAIRVAQLGAKVVLVEKEQLGGTCLHRGCIPTKALLKSTELLEAIKEGSARGVHVDEVRADLAGMMRHKNQVVAQLVGGIRYLMQKHQVKVVNGTGALAGLRRVRISVPGQPDQVVEPAKTIIATGSAAAPLPLMACHTNKVLNSDEMLELQEIPQSLAIVGGGAIGVEFASIFAALGTRVTIIEVQPTILPMLDGEVVQVLQQSLAKKGVECLTGARAVSLAENGQGLVEVQVVQGEREKRLQVTHILNATGRRPFMDGLNLHQVGIKAGPQGILVDDHMETSVEGVYAVGDVTGKGMLAHVAAAQAMVAAANVMGHAEKMNYQVIPNCIYTSPEVAVVGLTAAEARNLGKEVKIGKFPFNASGKALAMGEGVGFIKIVSDAQYGEILGAQIIGPRATDLIAELALAMRSEVTVHEISSTIHAHPTLSEGIMEAAHVALGHGIHV